MAPKGKKGWSSSKANGTTATGGRHTPPNSMKVVKRGTLIEVKVHLPKSAPASVLDLSADDSGFKLNTGLWGGGYALDRAWPEQVAGRVKAGDDVEVKATYDRGVLTAVFEVEGAGGAEASVAREFAPPRKGKQNNPKQGAGKRARDDYAGGAQRAKKSRAAEAGVQVGGEAEAADGQKREAGGQKAKAEGKAETGKKAASSKKGGAGALLEDKGAQLAMIDYIGASKEGKISAKLSQEKDKIKAHKALVEKRAERKAAKVERKEAFAENLKKVIKKPKKKAAAPAAPAPAAPAPAAPAGGDAGMAKKPAKKRISWGGDQVHSIPARANR